MKALLCPEPGKLRLIEREAPKVGAGDVLLRVRRVGICGTDYHILGGTQPYLSYPRIMGHELGAEIVAAPAGSGLTAGTTAVVIPYLSCGQCRACQRGLTNCCRRVSVLGVHQDGGMTEYIAVPAQNVIAAPELTLDQAAMVEFLAIGAHGIRRGAVRSDDRVLVVGAGPIGIAATIFACARGAEVTVMDLRQDRLDFAQRELGAAHTVKAGPEAKAKFEAITEGEFFDVVIDATGHPPSMNAGLFYLGHGGRYVLLSIVAADIAFPDPEFHKRETTLIASRNALPDDFAEVMRAIAAGLVPTSVLASHRATMAEGADAIPVWARPETGVIKALLEV
ncbi:zinc-binding alcohol dehydrogenase family protein [Acidisoma cellulosilytica]|uniref:Zinc-binding alcohol dehydrogenase family protein n=1 Tax=Acidisoma cellulosilyticum TaxID=2802395 RepID=A0A963Z1T1_9PROT|nr:zinc-binding alcohol dehydrogenase family protein [Acidisoma cellulosilyticum]MCB8880959.1 zinc-binding alcohol dehydrogenase family protein [Acidisoma cellulosilyticum]